MDATVLCSVNIDKDFPGWSGGEHINEPKSRASCPLWPGIPERGRSCDVVEPTSQ